MNKITEEMINDSGFEILEVEWVSKKEFIVEMKLIDEDGIYTGYCELREEGGE